MSTTKRIPSNWNVWWVYWWLIASPSLVVSAFVLPFVFWLAAATVGFLIPEMISITKKQDRFPPLTHTIRHLLPNWIAFPLIYFSLGSVGAHWLQFARPISVGALMGLLGWLTDHFTVTYLKADPFPYANRAQERDLGSPNPL